MGIHFLIGQILASLALVLFTRWTEDAVAAYYDNTVLLTGLTGILAFLPAAFFYGRDKRARVTGGLIPAPGTGHRLSPGEILLLLFMGAGVAQYGNLLASIVQVLLQDNAYSDTMTQITEGKSLWMLIFWMGIVAPVAEEAVFRWLVFLRLRDFLSLWKAAVISAVIFGIYHGNAVQGVYAAVLGVVFAWVLEKSGSLWSSVLLHIGANVWILLFGEYYESILEKWGSVSFLILLALLLAGAVTGLQYYHKKDSGQRLI